MSLDLLTQDIVNMDEMADLLDLKPRRIQQLAEACIVQRAERGQYHARASVRGYIHYLRDLDTFGGTGEVVDVRVDRRRLMAARASLAELDEAVQRGELARAVDIEAWVFGLSRAASEALFAMPDRLASLIAAEDDAGKVRAMVAEEIEHIVGGMQDSICAMFHRAAESG